MYVREILVGQVQSTIFQSAPDHSCFVFGGTTYKAALWSNLTQTNLSDTKRSKLWQVPQMNKTDNIGCWNDQMENKNR